MSKQTCASHPICGLLSADSGDQVISPPWTPLSPLRLRRTGSSRPGPRSAPERHQSHAQDLDRQRGSLGPHGGRGDEDGPRRG